MKPILATQLLLAVIFLFLILQTSVLLLNLYKHDAQREYHTFGYGSTFLAWLLCILFYKYMVAPYALFTQLKLSNPPADPVFGNLREMASVGFNNFMLDNIKKFGNVFGIYIGRRPVLCIADPDMLKQILVRDFSKFAHRSQVINHMQKPMDLSLVFLRDAGIWKKVRSVVTPAFSASKLKQTIPIICECLESLENDFHTAATEKKSLDVWLAYGKFTSDVIISSAFGKSPNRHSKADMTTFNHNMEELFPFKLFVSVLDMLNIPEWLRNLFNNFYGGHDVSYFLDILRPVIKERRESDTSLRRDLLDLILNENENGITKLTDNEIMAQCVIFLLAGYETMMNALAYSTYLLALNPDIQDKLYNEIKEHNFDNSPNSFHYDNVQKLEYLDQVFSEALRCYPPAYFVMRQANEDYNYNGIHVPKGMDILIPIYAIHHSIAFWEDPERFDPERFNAERIKGIKACTYLPFGYGSRNCIGLRFAQLEGKIALVHLVKHFKFEKSVDTEIPLSVRLGITMSAINGIYLKVSSRT